MWQWDENRGDFRQKGSLVLGTGAANQSEMSEAERRKYARIWQINIDKRPQQTRDRHEAEAMLSEAQALDYETMFLKSKEKRQQDEQEAGKNK